MTGIMGTIPTPGGDLGRRGDRPGRERVGQNLRPTRKARSVKTVVIEQVRTVQAQLLAGTREQVLSGLTAFLVSPPGDVIDLQLQVGDTNNWGVLATYAPNDDQAAFQTALNDWLVNAGENDLVEIQYQHTDRVYRAMILYAEN